MQECASRGTPSPGALRLPRFPRHAISRHALVMRQPFSLQKWPHIKYPITLSTYWGWTVGIEQVRGIEGELARRP